MKKIILKSLFALALMFGTIVPTASAQCSGGVAGAGIAPTAAYQTVGTTAGTYLTFTGVAGVNYEFTYCAGGASGLGDPQITILDNTGAYAGGYNDDACGLLSNLIWTCPSAGTYRVLIARFYCNNDGTNHGTMAYRAVPPSNDLCAGAIAIAMPSTTIGNTTLATVDATPYGGSSNGVWYSLTGNGNQFTFTTCGGVTNYDTYLAAYTGGCAGLTGVIVNDDACGLQSSITFCTTAGTPYLIHVYGFSTGNGSFTLNATEVVIPTPAMTPAAPAVCVGSGVSITASGSSSYTWSPATGLSSTTTATVTATPATTTTYTVTGNTNGCTATATVTVTVNALPTVTATSTASTVCAGTMVTLNGGGATTYAWDNSVIDGAAFTPTATTTYVVTGTDVNSCTNTASTTVTVNALPTVTATSTASAVCAGTMVTLSGGGATTYSWDNSVIDGAAFTPTATTTYVVTGTDVNSCTNTASTTVTVNALPTVTATSTASAVCAGTMATLSGGGATTYSWDNSVIDGAAFTPTATTTYVVTGTDVNSCTNTASTTVTVNALPTVTASSSASTVCAGDMVTLTGGGATTYVWDNSVVDAVAFAATATTTYNVTGTDINGCINVASVMVTVNALPTVTATSTASAICAGDMVTLTGGGATTYTWDNSVVDGVAFAPASTLTYNVMGTDVNGCMNTASTIVTVNALPTVTASSSASTVCAGTMVTLNGGGATTYTWDNSVVDAVAFAATATTTYNVTGTDVNGCVNTASTTVAVNALPTVTATSTASAVCAGTMVTLSGGGATTYSWDNSVIDGAAFTPTATTTYVVTGTDVNSCTNTASTTVTVNALPTVTASVDNDTVCAGTMIILTGGGAVSYTWDNGVTDGVAFAATDTITYSVTGTDANTCQNTASVNVLVYELPAVTLTSFTAPICLQAVPMALTGGSPTGGVYAGTGVSAGMFDPSVAGVGSFPITYSITDANACSNSASSNITVQDCTGIDENLASKEVNVYPNPTIGSFTISINNANFSELQISIVNVQGKEVFSSLEKNVNGTYNKNINLESVSKGLYFIKLNSGSEMRVQKLIVQ